MSAVQEGCEVGVVHETRAVQTNRPNDHETTHVINARNQDPRRDARAIGTRAAIQHFVRGGTLPHAATAVDHPTSPPARTTRTTTRLSALLLDARRGDARTHAETARLSAVMAKSNALRTLAK